MPFRFNWSSAKRTANLQKHGIDFTGCEAIFDGNTLTVQDNRFGEDRYITTGLLDGRVVVVVHTETSRMIRIISIRKATSREQETYFRYFRN